MHTRRGGGPSGLGLSSPWFEPDVDAARWARTRVDLRLLPLAAGTWGAAAVVIARRTTVAQAMGMSAAVGLCVLLAVVTVRRFGSHLGHRGYHGSSQGFLPVSAPVGAPVGLGPWLLRRGILVAIGTVLGTVRAATVVERADRHWIVAETGGHVLLDESMSVRVASVPRQLSEPTSINPEGRYGMSVVVDGMPGRLFLSGDSSLEQFALGDVVTGLVSVRAAHRLGVAPVTLMSGHDGLHKVEQGAMWVRASEAIRVEFSSIVSRFLGAADGGLARGMVVGDTRGQALADQDRFVHAGLSHLSAVSGANLAIVMATVLALVSTERPAVRLGVVSGALGAFVLIVGPDPAVLRAGVAAACGLLATAVGRNKQAASALCAGVVGLVVWDPHMAVQLGFALSCAATLSIVVLTPLLTRTLTGAAAAMIWRAGRLVDSVRFLFPGWLVGDTGRLGNAGNAGNAGPAGNGFSPEEKPGHGVCPALITAVAVCVAAEIGTTPLLLMWVGQISLLSLVANMLVTLVIAPITIIGTCVLVVSGILVFVSVVSRWCQAGAGGARLLGLGPLDGVVRTAYRGCGWGLDVLSSGLEIIAAAAMAICAPFLWWIRTVARYVAGLDGAQLFVGSAVQGALVCGILGISVWAMVRAWGRPVRVCLVCVLAVAAALAVVSGPAAVRDRQGEFSAVGVAPGGLEDGMGRMENGERGGSAGGSGADSLVRIRPRQDSADKLRGLFTDFRFPPDSWLTAMCPMTNHAVAQVFSDGKVRVWQLPDRSTQTSGATGSSSATASTQTSGATSPSAPVELLSDAHRDHIRQCTSLLRIRDPQVPEAFSTVPLDQAEAVSLTRGVAIVESEKDAAALNTVEHDVAGSGERNSSQQPISVQWVVSLAASKSTKATQERKLQLHTLADGTPVTLLPEEGLTVLLPRQATCSLRECSN